MMTLSHIKYLRKKDITLYTFIVFFLFVSIHLLVIMKGKKSTIHAK